MNPRHAVLALCVVVALSAGALGCTRVTGPGGALRWKEPDPSTEKAASWELRRNPLHQPTDERRQGEPEYVWVEANQPFYKDPPTLNRLLFGPEADLAPPDVRERLEQTRPGGPRPGGGSLETMPAVARTEPPPSGKAALPQPSVLGYVVEIRGGRLYSDLTMKEGVGIGTTLVILREVGELKHPITGKSLGQADEEIGLARVIEIRTAFSIAEILELKPGAEVRVKDRLRTSIRP